jgi:hypothetical protein
MDEPIQIVPKIVRWGIRRGSASPKFGLFFGGKRGGKGQTSNSGHNRKVSPQRLLVEQAMRFGWLNGHRLRKKT